MRADVLAILDQAIDEHFKSVPCLTIAFGASPAQLFARVRVLCELNGVADCDMPSAAAVWGRLRLRRSWLPAPLGAASTSQDTPVDAPTALKHWRKAANDKRGNA
jgi:hypothetical protein